LPATYLTAIDPEVARRTWQTAMDELTKTKTKTGNTHHRHVTAMKDKALDLIRNLPILETQSAHFLKALELGGVSTNVYLRRIHNFGLDIKLAAVVNPAKTPVAKGEVQGETRRHP
jgi:hypothetical protein